MSDSQQDFKSAFRAARAARNKGATVTKDQIRAAKALKVASETRYSGDEPKTTLEPSKEVVARAMPPPPPRSAVTSNPAPAASYHADSQGTRYHDRGIASDSNLHSEPSVNKNVFSAIGASQQGGDARSVGASTGQVSSAGILHGGSTVIAQQGSSLGAVGNLPRRTISIEGSTGPVLAGGGGGDDQKEDVAVTSTLSTRVESWGDAVPGTAAAAMASNIDGVMDGSAAACSAISTAYAAEQNDGKAKILGASDQKMHGSRRKRAHPDAEEINDYEKPTNARKTSAGLPDDFFQQNQQSAVGAATTAGSWHAKGQENAEAEFETFMAEVGAADGAKDEPTKGANKDAGPAADVQTGGDEDGEDDRAAREDFEHFVRLERVRELQEAVNLRSKASLQAEPSALEVAGVMDPDADVPEIHLKKKTRIEGGLLDGKRVNGKDIVQDVSDNGHAAADGDGNVSSDTSDDELDAIDWRSKRSVLK